MNNELCPSPRCCLRPRAGQITKCLSSDGAGPRGIHDSTGHRDSWIRLILPAIHAFLAKAFADSPLPEPLRRFIIAAAAGVARRYGIRTFVIYGQLPFRPADKASGRQVFFLLVLTRHVTQIQRFKRAG